MLPSLQTVVEGGELDASSPEDEDQRESLETVKEPEMKKLGWKLHEELHKRKRQGLEGDVAGLKKYALVNVTTPTSADFLSLPFQNPATRVSCGNFTLGVRTYLGLPTTSDVCWIDGCA